MRTPRCRLAMASSNEVPKPSPELRLRPSHKWEGDSRCELIWRRVRRQKMWVMVRLSARNAARVARRRSCLKRRELQAESAESPCYALKTLHQSSCNSGGSYRGVTRFRFENGNAKFCCTDFCPSCVFRAATGSENSLQFWRSEVP
jgi:hypothetical protein